MATKTEGETKEEKSPAVVDGPAMAEKTKDELWEECVSLQEELERVRKQKKHFKLQRDNAQRSWDNSRRNLEETKARMREKLRLKQEAEKRRQAEIEEHEQKLKQLETAHYNEICGLKMATIVTTSKTQKEHVESEIELQKKMHNLQAYKQEKESRTKIYIGKLKQKQQDELRELNESYGKQVREMEAEYQNKMKIMVEENNKKTQTELDEIDKRMKKHTASVIAEHDKAWSDVSEFIKDQNHRQLDANKKDTQTEIDKRMKKCTVSVTADVWRDLIELDQDVCKEREMLERQLEAANKKDMQLDRKMAAAVQENEHLTESLQEMESKLCESRQQLAVERKAMAKSLKRGKKITARILKEGRDLYLKQQQLELKDEQVQQEYDKLQKRQTEAILDVQQRSGLKDMLLERKIKAVTEIQEKEQFKLWVALALGQGDQMAAKNIKELFEAKDATIKALKDDVSRDLKEYDDLVKKATAFDISVDKWLPRGDIKKCTRSPSEDKVSLDRKNFDDLIMDMMQELTALCISEDNSVQKDDLGLNPAGAESRQ